VSALPRAPSSPYYRGCGCRGLPAGRYPLYLTAEGWFYEKDNANNFTWTDLDITSSGVKVLRTGPFGLIRSSVYERRGGRYTPAVGAKMMRART
jgi:hypothetical protein